MFAIITKILPATDTKGQRVKASCIRTDKTVTTPWDYGLGDIANHLKCVKKFIRAKHKFEKGHKIINGTRFYGNYAFADIKNNKFCWVSTDYDYSKTTIGRVDD